MDKVTLEVKTRDKTLSAKDLRRQSLVPIEYYGRGIDNQSLQVDYQDFRRVFRKAGGNTVVVLKIDGKEEKNVLIHDVSLDPVTDAFAHVDVVNVRMDEEIHTKIPLEFVGQAPAVKELGGIFMANLNELDVKCLPGDLIHTIEVNIESLVDFHCYIKVKDLIVPQSIAVLNDPEEAVATVVAPREEEEEVIPAEGEEGEEKEDEAKEGEGKKDNKKEEESGQKKE